MSIAEKVALKLSGRLGKQTLHVQWMDGSVTELQIDEALRIDFCEKLRESVLRVGYDEGALIRLTQVRCYQAEDNKPGETPIP